MPVLWSRTMRSIRSWASAMKKEVAQNNHIIILCVFRSSGKYATAVCLYSCYLCIWRDNNNNTGSFFIQSSTVKVWSSSCTWISRLPDFTPGPSHSLSDRNPEQLETFEMKMSIYKKPGGQLISKSCFTPETSDLQEGPPSTSTLTFLLTSNSHRGVIHHCLL